MRVVVVSGKNHPDYDLAFAAAIAPSCTLLLCVADGATEADLEPIAPATIRRFEWPRHRQAAANLRLLFKLRAEIKAFAPDVVHILSEGQVWLTLLPFLLWRIPVVVTLHDVETHPGDRETAMVPRGLVNAFVRRAAAVIVHGEGLKALAVEKLGLKADAVFTAIHPLIRKYRRLAETIAAPPRALAAEDPGGAGPLQILFFGRIVDYKGLADLIAADALLDDGDDGAGGDGAGVRKIVIAGRGACAEAEAAAGRRPDRYDLRFRTIADDEAAALFADADVLVLPYREASQSGVLSIAPTFGLPVIATDVGELGAVVRATGMGLLVPANDPAALAAALASFLADPSLRASLAAGSARAADGAFEDAHLTGPTLAAYAHAVRVRAAVRGAPGGSPKGRRSAENPA
jgi:glycosyltransferase involved in cell wall biosynthesis